MSLEEEYDEEVTGLYRKFAGRVQGFLIGMGCDRGLAEEITDDAFLAARRRWEHVRTLDEPEGYVFKIARNERGKRQRQHDCRAQDLHPDPCETRPAIADDVAQSAVDRALLRQALGQLGHSQREAVILRHAAGLSEAMAAQAMGISIGSVKRYTSEGRGKLRDLLGRPEGNGR